MDILDFITDNITQYARRADQRPGQFLFNNLPNEASSCLIGRLIDPFQSVKTNQELRVWINDHLIFADGTTSLGEVHRLDPNSASFLFLQTGWVRAGRV